MSKNKMNIIILAVYVSAMIFITILQLVAILSFPIILDDEDLFVTFSSVTNLLLYVPLFFVFIYIFRKYLKEKLKDLFENKQRNIIIIIVGFAVMLIASLASSLILELLGVTETSENQEALNMLIEGTLFDKIALFSFAVLFVPLIEELVFRKAILDMFHFEPKTNNGSIKYKILKIISAIIAVLISSLTFGFIHVMSGDFVQIIYYGGLGIVLGVIYLTSNKNILVPVIVHFMLNLMVTSILFSGF